MRLWSSFRSWLPRGVASSVNKRQRFGYRPAVELLEDRTVLSIYDSLSVLPVHPRLPSQPNASVYVNGLYFDLLHRQASPQEVAGWVTALNSGMPRSQVTTGFVNSLEFRSNEIVSFYQNILNR